MNADRCTYRSPQHRDDYCCGKAPDFKLVNDPHDDVDKDKYDQRKATPIGRKDKQAQSHGSVICEGAWELELGQEHEEQDDVDGDSDEVDKLWAACG